MSTHIGIELSPAACRIIEIEGGVPWVRRRPNTQVLSFEILVKGDSSTQATLEKLRKRPVAVVVWGVPTDHRQVIVANGSYEAMRREALETLAGAGIETRGVLADIAPATRRNDRSPRRPVVAVLAAAAQMTEALAPLTDAGIRVRSLLTPAAALTSLARTRRTLAVPDSIEAYVALDETATCIALVRNGALITARELSWGYLTSVHFAEPPRLDHLAARIAGELSEFFGAIGSSMSAASQVCVCGGLPDLRSMTVRLTEMLDVEVEPLDSLYGLDPDSLSDRADEFRERSAEMRLAWAAATDWPPTINLLRPRRRQIGKTALSRAAIVAGAVAGLAVGWQIQRSTWLRWPSSPPVARTAPMTKPPARSTLPGNTTARPAAPPVVTARSSTPSPPVLTVAPSVPQSVPSTVAPKSPPPAPSTVVAAKAAPPPPVIVTKPAPPPAVIATKPAPPPAVVATKPATPAPVTARATPANAPGAGNSPSLPVASTPPRANAVVRREPERVAASQPAARSQPIAPAPRTALLASAPPIAREEPRLLEPATRRQPVARTAPSETVLPFDASLGTILYSADRKLAIVDGRIIGIGDEVRGARVTDITPAAVFLRDAQGKLRRLTLAGSR